MFQAGPRICLGKDLALYEVKVLLVELLRKFRFEFPDEDGFAKTKEFREKVSHWKGEALYFPRITMVHKKDLFINVYERN